MPTIEEIKKAQGEAKDHVRVGDIYVSPRGTPERMFIDLGGWMWSIDETTATAILKELGVNIVSHARSSWQHENWRIDGDDLVIELTVGSATPNPINHVKRLPKAVVRETFLLATCPHFTKEGETELKACRYCIYGMEWENLDCILDFADWMVAPFRAAANARKTLIKNHLEHGNGYGLVSSWMKFKIIEPDAGYPSRIKRLFTGLRSTHCIDASGRLNKYYSHTDGIEHSISLDEKTGTGKIEARETIEIACEDDWLQFKGMNSKENNILRAFAEVCWWADGKVEAIPLTSAQAPKTTTIEAKMT